MSRCASGCGGSGDLEEMQLAKHSVHKTVWLLTEARAQEISSISFTTNEAEAIDGLTAASAQSVRLVVTFTKGRGTLRYWEVSCGPDYQLMSKPSNVLILS